MRERKQALYYAAVVLATTTLFVACFHFLHITSNWAANMLMFVPGLAAVLFRLRSGEGFRSVGWGAGPAIYWLWAIVLPLIVISISVAVSLRLGYAALAPASTSAGRLVTHPFKLLENIFLYIAISTPLAFGEEFGWRGYLQGKAVRGFGLLKGLLLLGMIWGLWHTPIYYAMGVYPDHPILGPFVMTPIDNILVVVTMAWFYIKSKNIWVPTLVHAFADVLWGFSDLIFPKSQEIHAWLVLQVLQLMLSIVLWRTLKTKSIKEVRQVLAAA